MSGTVQVGGGNTVHGLIAFTPFGQCFTYVKIRFLLALQWLSAAEGPVKQNDEQATD